MASPARVRSATSCLSLADLALRLVELVERGDACHHRQPAVADFAETALERIDLAVEGIGQHLQMRLLAFLAGHAVLAAVDLDIDLGHSRPPTSRPATCRTVSMASTSRRDTSWALSSSRLARALALSRSAAKPAALADELLGVELDAGVGAHPAIERPDAGLEPGQSAVEPRRRALVTVFHLLRPPNRPPGA